MRFAPRASRLAAERKSTDPAGVSAGIGAETSPADAGGGTASASSAQPRGGASDSAEATERPLPLDTGLVPWIVSGATPGALRDQAARLSSALRADAEAAPSDVAYALAATRTHFKHRAAVLAREREGHLAGLASVAEGRVQAPGAHVVHGSTNLPAGPVLVFGGQGSQWPGMGAELLRSSRVFRERIADCEQALAQHVDYSPSAVLRGEPDAPGLERVDVVQPVLWAVMVALAQVWRSVGVEPAAVVGHSQGEVAAACVAGALSLEDAAAVVALRSRAVAELVGGGAMASLGEGAERTRGRAAVREGGAHIAALNGPAATVVAGDREAVAGLVAAAESEGVRARTIDVDYASHTPHVEAVRARIADQLAGITPRTGGVPFFSTVTGTELDGKALDAAYWYRNLREPVLFGPAVRAIAEAGHGLFIESGPHPVLPAAIEDTLAHTNVQGAALGTLRRDDGGPQRLLTSLAEAYVRGAPVDWSALLATGTRHVVLPTYAFQRSRYWLETPRAAADPVRLGQDAATHPLLGAAVDLAEGQTVCTGRLSPRERPWLADHIVRGRILLAGAALAELAASVGQRSGCRRLEELVLQEPVVLADPGAGGAADIQVTLSAPDEQGRRACAVYSRTAGGQQPWQCHARATLSAQPSPASPATQHSGAAEWPPPGAVPVDLAGAYARLAERGYEYGPAFRGLGALWRRGTEVLAEVSLPEPLRGEAASFGLHPVLLDAALHAWLVAAPENGAPRVPYTFSGLHVHAVGAADLRVRLRPEGEDGLSLALSDTAGAPVASVDRLVLRPLPDAPASTGTDLHTLEWPALAQPPEPSRERWAFVGIDPDGPHTAGDHTGSDARRGAASIPDLAEPGEGDRHAPMATATGGEGKAEGVGTTSALEPQPRSLGPDPGQVGATSRARSDGFGRAADTVEGADTYPDAEALRRAVDGGAPVPEAVAVACPAGSGRDSPQRARAVARKVLALAQWWAGDERFAESKLFVVTRDAVAATALDRVEGLAQACAWGLLRSAQTEHPNRFVLVDDDGAAPLGPLLRRVAPTGETQAALRAGRVHVPRVTGNPSPHTPAPPGDEPWHIDAHDPGSLDDAVPHPAPWASAPLEPGRVRIAVRAAGVNFRDVVVALGLLEHERGMGIEGAGVVTEVGPDVTGLAVGDRVMGLFDAAFGPVAVAERRRVARIPRGWSFERAAAVPVAYLTAYYGLVDLAGLRPGEAVLVHAAAGGVGTAAVAVARHLGAEVFATASPGKWPLLRTMGLNDAHLASSRTTAFPADFAPGMADRGGVDVVLNALTGGFVDASLGLLAPGGRFLEMGKTDLRDPARVAADHPGVAYLPFNLPDVPAERIGEMLAEVLALLEEGRLGAPPPVRRRPLRDTPAVLRDLQQGATLGKTVLVPHRRPDPDGTVLITGGTGTLGAAVARHLVTEHGAHRLLLIGRSGPMAAGTTQLIAELTALGAHVEVRSGDAADHAAMARLLAEIPPDRPLTAVVHAAGVLEDATLAALTPAQLDRVLAAKVDGAWHLHELTAGSDLAAFVLFSSAMGVLGGPGQANYAAANTFLDGLAHYRAARGLSAASLSWGLWAQSSGLTGELDPADVARMRRAGLEPMNTRQALGLLDSALALDRPHLIPARLRTERIGAGSPPAVPRRQAARPADTALRAPATGAVPTLTGLPAEERRAALLELVREHAAAVLGHSSPSALPPHRQLTEAGIDSLTAVELRNRLAAATGLRLPATILFDHPAPAALAAKLSAELGEAGADDQDPTARQGAEHDDDHVRAQLQEALINVPADRLRESGLLDALRELARAPAEDADPPSPEGAAIDAMSLDDLVALALTDDETHDSR